MYRLVWLFATLLLTPSCIYAASASFPPQSVWLSNTKPMQGDKVRIYAVVYNGSDVKTEGAITFLVDGKINESKQLSLDSGESEVAYSTWTASQGEHNFSARFGAAKAPEAEVQTSISIVATVSAPPTATEQALTQAKDVGSQIASTSLPIISTVANTIFDATESVRNAGLSYFESKQPATVKSSPAVLGTSTVNQTQGFQKDIAAANAASTGIVDRISQTASVAGLAIFRSLWLFYPILVAFLLFIARVLYKWITRPRF